MRFSVLIPVYNTSSLINECLESILRQNYSDFEIIIVDDGSTDDSSLICDRYAEKYSNVRVIHQNNQKLYSARLHAAQHAIGDYVLFVDSDDFVEPNYFCTLDSFLKQYSCDMVFFNANIVDMHGNKQGIRNFTFSNNEKVPKEKLIRLMIQGDCFNPIWIKCIKRSAYKPSPKYTGVNMAEDVLNTVQILKRCESIRYCNQELYNYRVNSASVTHNIGVDHLLQANIAKNELYHYALEEFGKQSQEALMYQKSYIKGLIWYCSEIGMSKLSNNINKLFAIKESDVYKSCLNQKKLPFHYKVAIRLFNNNIFCFFAILMAFRKKCFRR